MSIQDSTPFTSRSSTHFFLPEGEDTGRKKMMSGDSDELVPTQATNVLANPTSYLQPEYRPNLKKTPIQIFGEFVTNQLECLESDEELLFDSQREITNIIWNARKKKL